MNVYMFGVITGLFLYFGGERLIKVTVRALKDRKVNSRKELVEIVEQIVNKKE